MRQHFGEKKITKACSMCGNEYGKFRAQCPACGHPNSSHKEDIAPPADGWTKALRGPSAPKVRKVRERKNPCIDCRRRVKDGTRCPHCEELIHKPCLKLHGPRCEEFQKSRLEVEARVIGRSS